MTMDNNYRGLFDVASYQISAYPYVTASSLNGPGVVQQVSFPSVTRFFDIVNRTSSTLKVAFDPQGFVSSNYFTLGLNESFSGEFRVSNIFLSATLTTSFEVIAGLTGIKSEYVVVTGSGIGY